MSFLEFLQDLCIVFSAPMGMFGSAFSPLPTLMNFLILLVSRFGGGNWHDSIAVIVLYVVVFPPFPSVVALSSVR